MPVTTIFVDVHDPTVGRGREARGSVIEGQSVVGMGLRRALLPEYPPTLQIIEAVMAALSSA
jgi:hypothetical protein